MATTLTYHYKTPFASSSFPLFHSPPTPLHLSISTKPKPGSFPLFAIEPPLIFLPLLQQEEQKDKEEQKVQQDLSVKDPILKFFKSRTSTPLPDPSLPGKLSLQSNRRSRWQLSPHSFSDPEDHLNEEDEKEGNDHIVSSPSLLSTSSSSSLSNTPISDGIVGEVLELARTLPENTTLSERLMGCYEGRISEEACVELLGLMGECGLVMCGLYLFEWMGLQEPSLVTARACTVLFPVLGKAGMGDQLLVSLRNLPRRKEFRDVHVYNAAISGLLCCKRYDDACKVYEDMEANNVLPDHVTCCIMITIMRKNGRGAKEVWEFFEKMNRKGIKWSQEVLGALVKSFCDEGLKSEALIIQTEMARKGIFPNAIVYNTIMDAYSKSNQIEEAEGLFAEMRAKGIKPTSASYNILMDAYSRRMQPEIIEKLIVEMQEVGLEPNAKSYTCLISAYGRQKKMSDKAANAFLRMRKVGLKPTSHSYTALIHAYSISGWHEKAFASFENMLKEGIKPSVETYTALLDAFRRAGDTETLMKIWKLMRIEKVEGTQVTFNILVDGFAKQGHYMEARDVISEFSKLGLHATLMTYNMLMNAYARGGQHSKLPQLLKEMATRNIKPDSVTYSTMIYAYVRVRDFKRAFYYHKQMVKSGQVPDAKSYEKLRAILDVKAAIKNRKDKSAILGIINSQRGLLKDKKRGKKDEFWKFRTRDPRTHNSSHNGH